MKKRICLIIIVLCIIKLPKVTAQDYLSTGDKNYFYEGGVSAGLINSLNDIGGNEGLGARFFKDFNLNNTQLNGSIYFGLNYKEMLGFRLEGSFGNVKANDSVLKNVANTTNGRYERNLNFKSKIAELSILTEIYPITLIVGFNPSFFSPYLVGGIGVFSFNPQTSLNGRTIDLQPLSTEGQGFAEYPERKPYKLTQVNIPIGVGIKYEVSPSFSIRTEFLYRILSTDYLDDVSTTYVDPALFAKYFSGTKLEDAMALNDRRSKTDPNYPINPNGGQIRGNPKYKDAYFTFNLKLTYNFGGSSKNE